MNENLSGREKSIDGLQYLRGIAALMVVFFHSRSYFGDIPDWTRIGSRGVDIFFVISGFIMVHATRNFGGDVSALRASAVFLVKRFIRVVPLYWVALLWAAMPYLSAWILASHSMQELYLNFTPELESIVKDFMFIPHLSIDEDERGEIFPVLIQGWTLNYEIIFYLVFGGAMVTRQYRIVVASATIGGAVLLGQLHHFRDVIGLFYTSTILLEFLFGMLVYEIYTKTRQLTFSPLAIVSLAVVGVLLLAIGSGSNDKVVLGSASAIIVWVFIQMFQGVHIAPLKLLGDASYSIYLFHLTAFSLARGIIKYLEIKPIGYGNITVMIMLNIAISIVAGIGVYYLVEKPLLHFFRKGLRGAAAKFKWPVSDAGGMVRQGAVS